MLRFLDSDSNSEAEQDFASNFRAMMSRSQVVTQEVAQPLVQFVVEPAGPPLAAPAVALQVTAFAPHASATRAVAPAEPREAQAVDVEHQRALASHSADSAAPCDPQDTATVQPALQPALQPMAVQPVVQPCLLYTSPSPRDVEEARMPSSA